VARIAGGPGLPDRVVARLLCSGRIRAALCDQSGNVLDLGRSQRLVSDKQYRALLIRDRGHCAHPGCTNRKDLDAHHVIHWLNGGRTDMNNLITLPERFNPADYITTTGRLETEPPQRRSRRRDHPLGRPTPRPPLRHQRPRPTPRISGLSRGRVIERAGAGKPRNSYRERSDRYGWHHRNGRGRHRRTGPTGLDGAH
jgi:hypothetical protein